MKEVKEVMALFYITPFSISVLNVAIMLALLIVFLWLIPEKFPATRHLLTFLAADFPQTMQVAIGRFVVASLDNDM